VASSPRSLALHDAFRACRRPGVELAWGVWESLRYSLSRGLDTTAFPSREPSIYPFTFPFVELLCSYPVQLTPTIHPNHPIVTPFWFIRGLRCSGFRNLGVLKHSGSVLRRLDSHNSGIVFESKDTTPVDHERLSGWWRFPSSWWKPCDVGLVVEFGSNVGACSTLPWELFASGCIMSFDDMHFAFDSLLLNMNFPTLNSAELDYSDLLRADLTSHRISALFLLQDALTSGTLSVPLCLSISAADCQREKIKHASSVLIDNSPSHSNIGSLALMIPIGNIPHLIPIVSVQNLLEIQSCSVQDSIACFLQYYNIVVDRIQHLGELIASSKKFTTLAALILGWSTIMRSPAPVLGSGKL